MFKTKIICIISILQYLVLMPTTAFAINALNDTGLKTTARVGYTGSESTQLSTAGVIMDIPAAIGKVIGTGLSFLGIAFMVLIIYGGFMWMFARGNDQAVGKAKEIIQAAVIGLVIVLSAYAITTFIGGSLGA